MSRKIKDIKDKNTGELVYPRTHVSAVVLSSDSTLEDLVEVKQDKIDDLDEIRSGAAKGATALQSYTEQYKGTVTGVKINGTTKNPSSGIVDLGTVITSHQDISGKQDKLVSGTNIKTINGNSILGSGDITISGGSSSDVYVTDFTIQDIIDLLNGFTDRCDMAKNSLIDAIANNRRIVVPNRVSEVGYYHIEGYVDDFIYLSLVLDLRGGVEFITIETSLSNSYCTLDEIYITKLPIKVSDLSNDRNFISSDNLKTINGESIVGSGDITISGGSSNANVQAVATGDVLDDVTVNYATKTYVDGLVGNINSILESIING